MSETILAAIIGAVATILAAFIGVWAARRGNRTAEAANASRTPHAPNSPRLPSPARTSPTSTTSSHSAEPEEIPGTNGLVVRVALERIRGKGPRLVQVWIKKPFPEMKGGSLILLSPDELRAGLLDRRYEGWSYDGQPRSMSVERSASPTTTLQQHYPNSSSASVSVDTARLKSALAHLAGLA